MSAKIIPFPARPSATVPPMPPELDLCVLDAELCAAEESYVNLRARLKGTRGKERARISFQLNECAREIVRLEQRRLRLTGPEICLLKGGKT